MSIDESGSSSARKGFGWGCGLTLGILAALGIVASLIVVFCLGIPVFGVLKLGNNAAETFNSVSQQIGTDAGPPRQKSGPTEQLSPQPKIENGASTGPAAQPRISAEEADAIKRRVAESQRKFEEARKAAESAKDR